jgi:hypothetical protein
MADYGIPVSGIVTIISTGLFLNVFTKAKLDEGVEEGIHHFW